MNEGPQTSPLNLKRFWIVQQLSSFLYRGILILFFMGQTFSFSLLRIILWNIFTMLSKLICSDPSLGLMMTLAMGSPMKLNQLHPLWLLMKHIRSTLKNSSMDISSSMGMLIKVMYVVDIFITILPLKAMLRSARNSSYSLFSYFTQINSGGCPDSWKSSMLIQAKLQLWSQFKAIYISLLMVALKSWLCDHSVQATKRKRLSKDLYSYESKQPVSSRFWFSQEQSSVRSILLASNIFTSSRLTSAMSTFLRMQSPSPWLQIIFFWQLTN